MSKLDLKSRGTGFLYLHEGQHYLITAWHNVTGRDFVTKQPLGAGGWTPERLHLVLQLEGFSDQEGWAGRLDFATRLYLDEAEMDPIWLVDAEQGSRLDIVAIPLRSFARKELVEDERDRELITEVIDKLDGKQEFVDLSFTDRPARLFAHCDPCLENPITVAQDIFVIGFPEALTAGSGTPIWKRGTVASEPYLTIEDRPCFLIDSATKNGLSGSPVVAKFENPAVRVLPTETTKGGMLVGHQSEFGFCGLYTSRLPEPARVHELLGDPNELTKLLSNPEKSSRLLADAVSRAQLGVVWSRHSIESVVSNGVPGLPASDYSALYQEGGDDPIA